MADVKKAQGEALAAHRALEDTTRVAILDELRRCRPDLPRPYRMWLYPLPAIVALVLWVYVWVASGLPGNALGNAAWVPLWGSIAKDREETG